MHDAFGVIAVQNRRLVHEVCWWAWKASLVGVTTVVNLPAVQLSNDRMTRSQAVAKAMVMQNCINTVKKAGFPYHQNQYIDDSFIIITAVKNI